MISYLILAAIPVVGYLVYRSWKKTQSKKGPASGGTGTDESSPDKK